MQSTFGTLNWADFGKGLLIAVLSAVLTVIYTTVQAGSLAFDWKTIATTALAAGLAYLGKNLFTNSSNQLGTTEPPK